MLAASYSPMLVAAAALVALMAAFTGLSLTNGLSRLPAAERKPSIAKAAIVLGGGVWSTHFVAMLALDLPVGVFYDPVYTLASALVAILLAGAGLLLLHFGERSARRVAVAGAVMGAGVVAMHYTGMWAMRGCTPVFGVAGYAVAAVLAVGMSVGALRLSSGERTLRGLVAGAAVYALAILAVHFSAMHWTGFAVVGELAAGDPLVSNQSLALLVMVAAFLICGAFLLTTATVGETVLAAPVPVAVHAAPSPFVPEPAVEAVAPAPAAPPRAAAPARLPYERDGGKFFTPVEDVLAIRAEGRYTRLHRAGDTLFCPLSINRLAEDLKDRQFLRTHRSYLVNLRHVRGFERRKDEGACLFDPGLGADPVPVSRAKVADTLRALGF